MTTARRPWLRPLVIGFVVFALAGATIGFTLMSRWSDVKDALPPEAQAAFDAALVESGGGPPYIEITATGTVVHRDLEGRGPEGFDTLVVLGWSATRQKIVRVEYPRWFVQMKISWGPNLGTMIAAARGDWGQIDLSVQYADLVRLGPGLILDHSMESGSRVMLWTTRSR